MRNLSVIFGSVALATSLLVANGANANPLIDALKRSSFVPIPDEKLAELLDDQGLVDLNRLKSLFTDINGKFCPSDRSPRYQVLTAGQGGDLPGQKIVGIGTQVVGLDQNDPGFPFFGKVLPHSSADLAGIKPGMRIFAVDGIDARTLRDHGTLINSIRGDEETEVLILGAEGNAPAQEFKVPRHRLERKGLRGYFHENLLEIELEHLENDMWPGFATYLNDLELPPGTKIALDLAKFPGGSVDVIENVMKLFAKENAAILYLQHHLGEDAQKWDSLIAAEDGKLAEFIGNTTVMVSRFTRPIGLLVAKRLESWGAKVVEVHRGHQPHVTFKPISLKNARRLPPVYMRGLASNFADDTKAAAFFVRGRLH